MRADSESTDYNWDNCTHLVPIRPFGTRPPLFCIFPGPPGAREFVDILPEDQPVFDFYFSKLDGASSFPAVEQLAEAFLQDLRKVQAHGPYQLFGYSNAGFIAYEMARLLLSQGEDVTFLALIDAWHPEFIQNLPLKELAQYRIMRFVDRLGKYRRFLIQGRFGDVAAGAIEFVVKRAKLIGWRATRFLFGTATRSVPRSMQVIESMISLQAYTPKPYAKKFMLFRPDDPVDKKLNDQTVGWHVCATEGVDVHFVRGAHGKMMDKLNARTVMDEIVHHLADPPRPRSHL